MQHHTSSLFQALLLVIQTKLFKKKSYDFFLIFKISCKRVMKTYTRSMFSIFFAYSLVIQMLSSFSGGHFLEVSRNIKDIKPISITFDDGPHRIRTMKILDILKSENIPATFFVVGNRLPKE